MKHGLCCLYFLFGCLTYLHIMVVAFDFVGILKWIKGRNHESEALFSTLILGKAREFKIEQKESSNSGCD